MNTTAAATTDDRSAEIAATLQQEQRDYLAYVQEMREDGYRPQHCIHGTNLWTDYDNICGGCEDGEFTAHTPAEDIAVLARQMAEGELARKITKDHEQANLVAYLLDEHGKSLTEAFELTDRFAR